MIRNNNHIMPKKSSKSTGIVLLTILLLLTIGGFGYWNYTLHTSKIKTYSAEHAASFTSSTENTYYDIPDLSISIDVAKGEEVHIMFTCTATITAVSRVS